MSLMWLSSFASNDKIDDINEEQYTSLAKLFHLVRFNDGIY